MRRPLWTLLATVALWQGAAVLGYAGVASAESPCLPTEGTLAADASLAGAAGGFSLTLVARQAHGKGGAVTGSLVLEPWDSDAFLPASSPLRGATDIDLEAVGAVRVGDPGSKDWAAPGVLVLESHQGGTARILLRLGADANRAGEPLFDGGYAVLEVAEIIASGFAGSWRSGVEGHSVSGHFCATRAKLGPSKR